MGRTCFFTGKSLFLFLVIWFGCSCFPNARKPDFPTVDTPTQTEPVGSPTPLPTSSGSISPSSDDREEETTLSTRELIDEALTLACSGAQQYQKGDMTSALTNMDAALINLQLADIPEKMQNMAFFQPYLPSECGKIDLDKAYNKLKQLEKSREEVPDIPLKEASFSGTTREFIDKEIMRFMENLGEEPSKAEDIEVFSREVERFIRYYQTTKKDWFEKSYLRMLKYQDTVERIFSEKRLPSDLAYLAFIESGYLYRATSRARARGIWQFMRSTGRMYGLRIGRHVDERLDPVKSTIAAREYLLDLISIFGSRSFLLAMASYNAGEGRVQRCLRKIDDPFEDRSFWKIRDCLRRETREYIPRIIAAGILCENPERFGMHLPARSDFLKQYDLVICPHRVRLSAVAKSAHITVSQLRAMNPDLPSGGYWTPVNNTHLWVPKGTSEDIKQALVKMRSPPPIPESSREYHIVRSGDSLYRIGRRYRIPYKKLAAWNGIRYPYKIKPKQRIYLQPPGAAPVTTGKTTLTKCEESLIYIVQKGNYLAGIGYLFGTTARSIMALNGLSRGTIFPGQRLMICPGFPVEIIQHVVAAHDTLGKLAKRYHIKADDIRFSNGLRKNQPLRIGRKLTMYRRASK